MSEPTTRKANFFDGLERSVWTVLQATTATGLVAGYQALPEPFPNIPEAYLPVVVVLLAGLLAGLKAVIAQRFGNGTAATLPADLEPVPADVADELLDEEEIPAADERADEDPIFEDTEVPVVEDGAQDDVARRVDGL